MNLLQITGLGNGHVEVSWRHGNRTRNYKNIPLADPMTAKDRGELRWYLEEYLSFPCGAEEYRARRQDAVLGWSYIRLQII